MRLLAIAGFRSRPSFSPALAPHRAAWTGVALIAFFVAATFAATPALAGCRLETVEMPVKIVGSRAVATIGINGTPVPMTVDTGAFFSNLTDAAAAQLGLAVKKNDQINVYGIAGKMESRVTHVNSLRIFKGDFGSADFIVGGNEPGAGTMGLMGRDILLLTDTEYDLAHGVIRFHTPNADCADASLAYWAGKTPVTELELINRRNEALPAIRAEAKLNGTSVVALFDTGATTIISTSAARRAGVAESAWKPAGNVYGVGRGSNESWIVPFDRFELGGEVITRNALRVSELNLGDADLLLGIDFFLSHRIYVSKQQSRMFITYNGGTIFALDRDGPATTGGLDAGKPAESGAPDSVATDDLSADQLARRGSASAGRRDYRSALVDLDRACKLEPASAAFRAERGTIHAALGHRALALDDYNRAIELDPAQWDARLGRARLRSREDRAAAQADLDVLDAKLPRQSSLRLDLSSAYLAAQLPEPAIAQATVWMAEHPKDVDRATALNNRCWAHAMLGAGLEEALDDCGEAIDGNDKSAAIRDSRGWVYLRLGRLQKAVADFDRSLAIDSTIASSLYGRSVAKMRLGDLPAAEVDLRAARKVDPGIEARMTRFVAPLGTAARSS